jgi:Domain of unknown function (DUF4412)
VGERSAKITVSRLKSISAFAVLFILLATTRADLVMTQQTVNTNGSYLVTVSVRGDKMRMDQKEDDGRHFSVIINLKTRDSITLMPFEKWFLRRPDAEALQQIETERKNSGGTNDMDKLPAPPADTGQTEKINGFDTEIYKWSGAHGIAETLWVATNFPDYENIKKELARLDQFNTSGLHPNLQPELGALPGMVVKTEKSADGNKSVSTLVSANEKSVDPSLFEIPADFSPWKPAAQTTNATAKPE